MTNTHRIDVWAGDPPKWVKFSEVPNLTIALNQAARTYTTARVVEISTGETVAGWRDGKRVR